MEERIVARVVDVALSAMKAAFLATNVRYIIAATITGHRRPRLYLCLTAEYAEQASHHEGVTSVRVFPVAKDATRPEVTPVEWFRLLSDYFGPDLVAVPADPQSSIEDSTAQSSQRVA